MNVSACTFIRNTIEGAFCLFESMAVFMSIVDDMFVLDLGSTDGTWELLMDIAAVNKKVRIAKEDFSTIDASAFADAANDCIGRAKNRRVIFWQADEIWHESMMPMFVDWLRDGICSCTVWRYQLRENFQKMKWFPHPVHRLVTKGEFKFVNDGMNTDNVYGQPICSIYDMGWFTKWGQMDPYEIPVQEMVMDVSMVGGFLNNIRRRRELHAPMWHEPPTIEDESADTWLARERQNPNWTYTVSPFKIPAIMRYHVGKLQYTVRDGLVDALKQDTCDAYLDACQKVRV